MKDDLDIAVKLVIDKEGNPVSSNEAVKEISDKLFEIRRLPIPQGINLSRPLAILKSHAGYVMTFMNEMKSFTDFMKLNKPVEKENIPFWLKDAEDNLVAGGEVWANYCFTGGLRTRLLALYKVSELLASLHMNGLVYGDISDGNLMYRQNEKVITAGLIDADNINFAGRSKTYFTPGFGAPEIVNGTDSATMYSDSYAFAVAAFYILTMMHPFKGKMVIGQEEDEDNWSKTVSVQNKQDMKDFKDDGSFPWIFDRNDDSNAYGNEGQARALFLNDELFSLFDNTFSLGHTKPHLRTPLSRWPLAFARAADSTVSCPSCGMSYYYEENQECPYCSAKKGLVVKAESFSKNKVLKHTFVHELGSQECFLPSRCFEPFRTQKGDNPIVALKVEKGLLEVRSVDDEKIIFCNSNGNETPLVSKKIINLAENASLSFTFVYKSPQAYTVKLSILGDER